MSDSRPVPAGCNSPAAEEFMSPHPFTVRPEHSLNRAWNIMRDHRVRHVPVADEGGTLQGLLTERDLLVLAHGSFGARIGEVMHDEVETIGPRCCVSAAAQFMLRTKKGCLPVVDDGGKLLGILTEADFLRWFVRERQRCACEPSHYFGSLEAAGAR